MYIPSRPRPREPDDAEQQHIKRAVALEHAHERLVYTRHRWSERLRYTIVLCGRHSAYTTTSTPGSSAFGKLVLALGMLI